MAESAESSQLIRIGAIEVDFRAGEVRKHGIRLKLQDQPFRVLTMLLERPGAVVTREELRAKLWPADTFVDFDHGLNSAINKLREALSDSADSPRYIETLPRRGYRFVAQLQMAPSPAPADTVAVPPPDTAAPSGPAVARAARHSHRRAVEAVGVALVMLAAGIYIAKVARVRGRLPDKAAPASIHSIAVLPLDNLSRDPDQEYFADGMTDELIAQLAKIKALRVISRTSVLQYKGVRKPLPQIARELGVDAILEGAILRSGDQVRITAELVDARTDQHLWAEDYARDLRDILQLQSDVAKAVAQEVKVKLSPQELATLSSGFSGNPDSYDLYLRGLYEWHKFTVESFQAALNYYGKAVEKDPGFAKAYTGIADSYVQLAGRLLPPREAMPKAKEAALQALRLDERLAEAHTSYAFVLQYYEWDWAGAEHEFRRALELNPSYTLVHIVYAHHLAAQGKTQAALPELQKAQELDPAWGKDACAHLRMYLYGHQYDQGVAILDEERRPQADRLEPCVWRGMLYEQKGRYADAIREYQEASQRSSQETLPLACLGRAYWLSGKRSEARKILSRLLDLSRHRFVSPFDMAVLYTGLGQKEEAFRWLDKAVSERAGLLVYLKVDPMFDPLRSDPRFATITRQVHIPE